MEAAAKLIVHASLSHGAQCLGHHVEGLLVLRARVITQQKIEAHRTRKLGRGAETAPLGVERTTEHEESRIENVFGYDGPVG